MPRRPRSHLRRLLFLAVFSAGLPSVGFADPCTHGRGEGCEVVNNGYGIVDGDQAYAMIEGRAVAGFVGHVYPDGSADFLPASLRFGSLGRQRVVKENLTIGKVGYCEPALSEFCVGRVSSRIVNGSTVRGKLVAIFPATEELLLEEGGERRRVARSGVETERVRLRDDTLRSVVGEAIAFFGGEPSSSCNAPEGGTGPAPAGIDELAARTKAGESSELKDLLQTWRENSGAENSWRDCPNKDLFDRMVKMREGGELDPACMPEVLYTWRSGAMVSLYEWQMGDGKWSEKQGPSSHTAFFASRVPGATYGYGSFDESGGIAIRTRLRPGTKFKYLGHNAAPPDCAKLNPAEAKSTVYVRINAGPEGNRDWESYSGEDFMLCSTGPVASWSYGTKEHYDELVRDLRFALGPATAGEWPGYMRAKLFGAPGSEAALFHGNSDRHPFTQTQLIASLRAQLSLSAGDQGAVHYAPDLREEKPAHFGFRRPVWFSGDALPPAEADSARAGDWPRESEFLRFVNMKDYRKLPHGKKGSDAYGAAVFENWKRAEQYLNSVPMGSLKITPELAQDIVRLSTGKPFAELCDHLSQTLCGAGGQLMAKMHETVGFASNPLWNPLSEKEYEGTLDGRGVRFWELPWPLSREGSRRGVVFYAERTKAQGELSDLCRWYEENKDRLDPVELAATFQRRFVIIHPFPDGNGRTSRLLMDRILAEHGLPPPILEDMDGDYFSSPEDWVRQVREGIDRGQGLRALEKQHLDVDVLRSRYGQTG